jgi:putative heme-binding domain-containing protein
MARDPSAASALRRAAIDAVGGLESEASLELLTRLAGGSDSFEIRAAAVNAAAAIAPRRAAGPAADLLAQLPPGAHPSAVLQGLLAQRGGPPALAAALAGKSLPADVAKLAVRTVQTSNQPSADLIAALRAAGKLEVAALAWTPQLAQELVAAVASAGDAARGEEIYRRAELQCVKCHAIAGAGGQVGPDLVSIGATAPVDYLVESMLAPNAKIKENYHSKLIATRDGRVITGIPIRESREELVVRDAEDREIVIPVASIEEKRDGRSLMPDGAADQMTRAELIDLLRFLSELGKVGEFAVGNAQLARRWETLQWTQEANRRLNRTSHDTAATDDPALTWLPAFSKVSGHLPLEGLPRFQPHRETAPTSFVRCRLEVTTPGAVRLELNDTNGLSMWLDGKPWRVEPQLEIELARGRHTLTFDLNHERRKEPLRVELLESAAQAQFVP